MAPVMGDEDEPTTFGALLRRHRVAAGRTQEALAERAGLGRRCIQGLERGRHQPNRDTLRRLVPALALVGEERARFEAAAQPAPRRRAPPSILSHPPAAGAGRTQGHNLPASLTSFIGRERELAAAKELLATTRLLTLTGAGGCGKTRLAFQIARDLLGTFPDAVWVVDFAPLGDPALVAQTAVQALGVRADPRHPPLGTLTDELLAKKALLVFDNCEHLIDACAHLVDSLLRACPEVRILATSREALAIVGEVRWHVPSLSLPIYCPAPDPGIDGEFSPSGGARGGVRDRTDNGIRLPAVRDRGAPASGAAEEIEEAEAVRLFVDRARAVAPTFALTPQNAAAVAQICWCLDGMPLAIEMAAARVAVLGVEQIASRLDERLRLLTGGGRTAPPRQQTLRAAVDWSHDLLTEDERVVFRRLAVFAGGWTVEAAEAVCGDPPGDLSRIRPEHVLDLLACLATKSLVVAGSQGGAARYHLLETIREYARDRLAEAGEAAAVSRHHYAWMLGQAERARPAIALGPRRRDWLDRLSTEVDNLRAALKWCLEDDPRAGLQLATVLQQFWYWRGHHHEAQRWLDRLLARALGDIGDALRAEVLLCSGRFAYLLGDYPRARRDLEESVRVYRTLADPAGGGWGLNFLGQVATVGGDLSAARARFEESLARFRLADDDAGAFWALQCWGEAEFNLAGDVERARALHEESLTLARKHGDEAMIGVGLFALGAIERTLGNDRQARDLMEQSLALYAESGDRVLAGWVVAALGDLALGRGDKEQARRLFHRGLASADQIGYRKQIAAFLGCWAVLAMQQGEHARGARLFGAASAVDPLFERSLTRHQVARHGPSLATARSRLGDAAFRAAWAEGQAMTREQAVAYAVEEPRG